MWRAMVCGWFCFAKVVLKCVLTTSSMLTSRDVVSQECEAKRDGSYHPVT